MAIWYIDPTQNDPQNDGHSADTPLASASMAALSPGDTILYRRGCIYREMFRTEAGTADAPITYGAYGDGDKPVFCGSLDASSPDDWEEIAENIWRYRYPTMGDVGNIIFVKICVDFAGYGKPKESIGPEIAEVGFLCTGCVVGTEKVNFCVCFQRFVEFDHVIVGIGECQCECGGNHHSHEQCEREQDCK